MVLVSSFLTPSFQKAKLWIFIFLDISSCDPFPGQEVDMVQDVTVFVHEEFNTESFDSCKNVQYPEVRMIDCQKTVKKNYVSGRKIDSYIDGWINLY